MNIIALFIYNIFLNKQKHTFNRGSLCCILTQTDVHRPGVLAQETVVR